MPAANPVKYSMGRAGLRQIQRRFKIQSTGRDSWREDITGRLHGIFCAKGRVGGKVDDIVIRKRARRRPRNNDIGKVYAGSPVRSFRTSGL